MNTNKTILLAITGASPAVVTETLYGIDRKGDEWPSEVKIITTKFGKKKAVEGLINEQQIKKLCVELRKPLIAFSEDDILVVTDAKGHEVDDARSVEDHEALANFIMRKVHYYTQDDLTKVHASIAGGRKTMTFYLGYAMSLFGRHFDRLSHVLISDGFENPQLGFYFPTRESHPVSVGDKEYDFKDAEVTLADIPFIRQRSIMPKIFDTNNTNTELDIDFRNLVDLVNLGDDAKNIFVKFYAKEQRLEVFHLAKPKEVLAEAKVSNILHWALYLLLVKEAFVDIEDQGAYIRPKKNENDTILTLYILSQVQEIFKIQSKTKDTQGLIEELINHNEQHEDIPKFDTSVRAIKEGLTNNQFSNYITKIFEQLSEKLPVNLARALTPAQIYQDESISRPGKGGGGYGIDLPNPVKQIVIVDGG